MYDRTYWKNHVVDQHGTVIQEGTPLDQEHFNKEESGISDMEMAQAIYMFGYHHDKMNTDAEIHLVTMNGTGEKWPFNNKAVTVALKQMRENVNYRVDVEVLGYSGGQLGDIEVFDRACNGFKLMHNGSATTVKLAVRVSGGMTDPDPYES